MRKLYHSVSVLTNEFNYIMASGYHVGVEVLLLI